MKIHFLTYYTPEYQHSAERLIKSAKKYGFDAYHIYTRSDLIKTEFYKQHRNILDLPQRAGCSLWKIYYMQHVYFQMEEGDILFYADAGSTIIRNPKPLIDIANENRICLFNLNNNPPNKHWTKRDTFVLMQADEEEYHNAYQTNAFSQLFKRCAFCDNFMNELLMFGSDVRIISDLENTCGFPNLEGFKEHRFDQSILAILATKYKVEHFRYPSQWGNHWKLPKYRHAGEWLSEPYSAFPMLNSDYDTIFDHHRNYSLWNELKKSKFWRKQYFLFKHKLKMFFIKS